MAWRSRRFISLIESDITAIDSREGATLMVECEFGPVPREPGHPSSGPALFNRWRPVRAVNHTTQAFGRAGGRRVAADLAWCALGFKGGRMLRLRAILRCEKGANAIEYALVASLIAIAAVGAFHNMANKIDAMYNNVQNHM
jgi:pilus assembly protein Flp/PilA